MTAESCREWLEILMGGSSSDEDRRAAEGHVVTCARCQRDLEASRSLDQLLGPGTADDHPSSAELVAHAAGEGQATGRQRIADHLARCPACQRLLAGATAGLEEAGRLEAGLALLGASKGAASKETPKMPLHLPLPLPVPEQSRALAADPALALERSALPTARRVLLEQGALRLVYIEVGGRGQLGLFGADQGGTDLVVRLDQEELSPVEQEREARVFDLGPAGRLPGRTLVVEMGRARRSWTLIEEEE